MELVKDSGEKETYSKEKFCASLRYAGAPEDLVTDTCNAIEQDLTPGVTTSEIFRKASQYLLDRNLHAASRYNLKRGIAGLGPAGFHFEKYIEAYLQTIGFSTKRNMILAGECVEHEIDVVAEKEGKTYLVEAKYHNKKGTKSHIDDVVYAEGRVEDIQRNSKNKPIELWLITNTKFSGHAIKYAKCRKLDLMGWNYPSSAGLQSEITKYKLYPVTVLPSVGRNETEQFAQHSLMLASDLGPYSAQDLIKKFNIEKPSAEKIYKEVQALFYEGL
tara:strand:- start:938 stop:1759 length:822 start_codon:yes stop_codon:yes gene_type:complete